MRTKQLNNSQKRQREEIFAYFSTASSKALLSRKITLTYFEAFAGIGAQAFALLRLEKRLPVKFVNVGISEFDTKVQEVYEKLHGAVEQLGDITKILFDRLMHIDLLFWSSPCQDASTAGKREGFVKGSGTRSALAWYLIPLLEAKQKANDLPMLIVFENVKGILQGENRTVFNEFVEAIAAFGYNISYEVINAFDHECAQHRERVFVVCSLIDISYEFPKPRKERVLLKDILEDDVDAGFDYNSTNPLNRSLYSEKGRTMRIHNPSYCEYGFTLSTHGTGRTEDNYIFREDVSTDPVVRANLKFLDKHHIDVEDLFKTKIRSITPKEALRLMGFNDDEMAKFLALALPKTTTYRLLGNSICIPVLEDILYEYFKRLFEVLEIE